MSRPLSLSHTICIVGQGHGLFSFFILLVLFFLFLLAPEVIETAVTEGAVARMMGFIIKYYIATPVALDTLGFITFFAYKYATILAYLIGFVFGYLFTADFTNDFFHRSLC